MCTMFWGVEVTSLSPVSLTAERPLHISHAVLVSPSDELHSYTVDLLVTPEPEGQPIQVCRFPPRTPQHPLDLRFGRGETVTLSLAPAGHVVAHLSGYFTDEQEEMRAQRIARADGRMDHLLDICNRILERTYHIN